MAMAKVFERVAKQQAAIDRLTKPSTAMTKFLDRLAARQTVLSKFAQPPIAVTKLVERQAAMKNLWEPSPAMTEFLKRQERSQAAIANIHGWRTALRGAGSQPAPLTELGADTDLLAELESVREREAALSQRYEQVLDEYTAVVEERGEKAEDVARLEQEMANLASQLAEVAAERDAVVAADNWKEEFRVYLDALPPALHNRGVELLAELTGESCRSFVLSADIRGSTSLMLHADDATLFANFLVELCTRLRAEIGENFGVFDKFTGDGVLAFFPEKLCGPDAWYYALNSATKCHEVFRQVFRKHQGIFRCRMADAGLGIGIDYGDATLVNSLGSLTLVGAPVVYACRLGGAPAGETHVNVLAYEEVQKSGQTAFDFKLKTVEVKHEDAMEVYRTIPRGTWIPRDPPLLALAAAEPLREEEEQQGESE